jgi:hypothetical protein
MDRRSPRTLCQFWTDTRVRVLGKEEIMTWRRSTRWGGSWMILDAESRVQPRTSLRVAHVPSPFRIFLTLLGSWRSGWSVLSSDRNTDSKAPNKEHLTCHCLLEFP